MVTKTDKASHAASLLNILLGDLAAARHSFIVNDKLQKNPQITRATASYWAIVHRAFLVHLVITLSKICEVYEKYRFLMPLDVEAEYKQIYVDLQSREIVILRNRFCAHIWDKRFGTPLSLEELNRHVALLCNGDLESLVPWFWNVDDSPTSTSIGAVIERCRNRLLQDFKLDVTTVCKI